MRGGIENAVMSVAEVFLVAMLIIFTVPYLIWRLARTDYFAPLVVVLYDWAFTFESFGDAVSARVTLYSALAATWVVLVALVWNTPRSTVGLSSAVGPCAPRSIAFCSATRITLKNTPASRESFTPTPSPARASTAI